ncbi:MAG: hypothetical protein NT121_19430, partial [Chloroflexi bacterium]|nr:hypothetical protein [Chloroflexota bacterium]
MELNRAYAHVSSASWPEAASKLKDRLVEMGFDKLEAAQYTQVQSTLFDEQPIPLRPQETMVFVLSQEPELNGFDLVERSQLTLETGQDKRLLLHVTGEVTPALEAKLIYSVHENDRAKVSQAIAEYHARPARSFSPAERGEPFVVPQLSFWVEGEPELAEEALDESRWNLLDYPAELTEVDFKIEEKTTSYEFDLKGEKLTYKVLGRQLPLDFSDTESGLTDLQLTRWLEPRLRQDNLRPETLLEFTRKTVKHLMDARKISLLTLVRARFQLLKALAAKLKDYQTAASQSNYSLLLFNPKTTARTTYDYSLRFDPKSYPANAFYNGSYQFDKHYYGELIGAFDNDDEFNCAQDLDRCEEVKYWVRNLVHDSWGFRLPLSNRHFFYPDFVAMLNDGRILVVEYKGAHLVEYSQEKKNIGELWAEKSDHKALFLMAVKRDEQGMNVYKQIENAIAK